MTQEIAHYGVKGMKWGVRKMYEGKGGSYTKKGVQKFNSKLAAHEAAKRKLQDAKASKNRHDIKEAKVASKRTKKALNKQYKQLARDKAADAGKELYKQGETMYSLRTKAAAKQVGFNLGVRGTLYLLENKLGRYTEADAIAKGSIFVQAALGLSDARKISQLRAYYRH